MSATTTHIETKKQLVPALRFKEFDLEWRETTLGNLFTFKNGLNSDKEKYGAGRKFINVLDIIGNDVITYDSIIGKVEVTEKELEKNEVIYGDVLFQRSSETREEVGQANIYVDENKSAVFGGFVIRGRKKEDYNPYFMNYLLKTSPARKEITTKSGGSTRYNVGQASLSEVFVNLTNVPEQQKIASFLSAVDVKIQQLTKKKELLVHYKKGVMRQLFHSAGSGQVSGQLRFKDENGNSYPDWEDKILDDVIHFSNGKGHEQSIDAEGDFVVVNSKFVSTEGRVRKFCNYQISPLAKGDIVKVMSDVPNGKALAKCYLIEKENTYTLNQRICGLRAKNNVNEFLIYLIHRNRYYLSFDSGVGQTNLKKDEVLNCPLYMPSSLKEQQKIATYLSRIDTKIENVNQQITQTQTFKKGLLQQMFV